MRILKFRAWNKTEQKMIRPPVELKQLLGQVSQPNDNSLGGDAIRRHELEWMQFTGLLDKSGVEIYEGDIILESYQIKRKSDGEEMLHKNSRVVSFGFRHGEEYESDSFNGWLADNDPLLDGKDVSDYSNSFWDCSEQKYEVVGNIYENPELLTK